MKRVGVFKVLLVAGCVVALLNVGPAIASGSVTSPNLALNPSGTMISVSPVGNAGASTGTLNVTVVHNQTGAILYQHMNTGSGIFTGPSWQGPAPQSGTVTATATTSVNGQVVENVSQTVDIPGSGGGGGECEPCPPGSGHPPDTVC